MTLSTAPNSSGGRKRPALGKSRSVFSGGRDPLVPPSRQASFSYPWFPSWHGRDRRPSALAAHQRGPPRPEADLRPRTVIQFAAGGGSCALAGKEKQVLSPGALQSHSLPPPAQPSCHISWASPPPSSTQVKLASVRGSANTWRSTTAVAAVCLCDTPGWGHRRGGENKESQVILPTGVLGVAVFANALLKIFYSA